MELRTSIEEKKARLNVEYEALQSAMDQHISLLQETEQKVARMRTQQTEDEAKLYQAYQYLQKARSRKEMLEEMQEEYTGFFIKASGKC
ncbi:hypothetical protein GCM10020331_047630 [Ectobacillus funiculus]